MVQVREPATPPSELRRVFLLATQIVCCVIGWNGRAVATPKWEVTAGPFAADPRLRATLHRATQARDQALRRWKDWAVGPNGPRSEGGGTLPRIRWIFDARSPSTKKPSRARYLHSGQTELVAGGIVVTLPLGRFLWRPQELEKVIAHEVAHAALAQRLGPQRYRSLPRWFREGLAVWFAGEGKARVWSQVAYSVYEGKVPGDFLVGVAPVGDGAPGAPTPPRGGPARSQATYAEAFLACDFIALRLRATGWRDLVRAIANGRKLDRELRSRLGMSPPEFAVAALVFSRDRVEKAVPPRVARDFQSALGLYQARRYDAAVSTWKGLLSRRTAAPLRGTVAYHLAKIHARDDSRRGRTLALAQLTTVLGSPDGLWRAEALLLKGRLLLAMGDKPAARLCLREVTEAYADDRAPATQARALLASSVEG